MEEIMLKASLMAASMAVLGLSTAYAAQDLCNDAHMEQMDQMIADMTDAAKKKEATEALDQSKAAMKAGNTAQCMKYMDEAHKAMGLRAAALSFEAAEIGLRDHRAVERLG
jgi:hypothetical protein